MAHYGKLIFVAAQEGEQNMDLFVHADDFLAAVRLWKNHFAGWDWPPIVKVFTCPPSREPAGVVQWTSMHNIEINPRDVV